MTLLVRSRAPYLGAVLAMAGAAWIWMLVAWRGSGAMPGAMGLGPVGFVGMWTVMMAAMMLPSTAPVAAAYARTVSARRPVLLPGFVAGYLAVWACAGLAGYLLAVAAGHAALSRPTGTALAAALFAANGVYQLSPLKNRCLIACRASIGLLLRYASWRGPTRGLRAGAHHGAFCLGCCATLMTLMVAFGVMNIAAMAVLAATVAVEKVTPFGPRFSRVVGLLSLAAAVAVVWLPAIAPGLIVPAAGPMPGMRMGGM